MKSSSSTSTKEESQPSAHPFLVSSKGIDGASEHNWGGTIAAGVIAGLAGTVLMTQFQNAWSAASTSLKSGDQRQSGQEESEDATMKAAGKIANLFGRELSHKQKKKLGPVVHYSFGTIQGAIYAVSIESIGVRGGLPSALAFGTGLFLVADEIGVPTLGLSGKASKAPLSSHIYALASHLVYGVSTEIVRKGLEEFL